MIDENPLAERKDKETLIGELDGNAGLFEYWEQTGKITAAQDGLYNYSTFLRLRAELVGERPHLQAGFTGPNKFEPPPSVTFSFIGESLTFWLENHDILVVVGNVRRRLNPSESLELLNFLSKYRDEFERAKRS